MIDVPAGKHDGDVSIETDIYVFVSIRVLRLDDDDDDPRHREVERLSSAAEQRGC